MLELHLALGGSQLRDLVEPQHTGPSTESLMSIFQKTAITLVLQCCNEL